MHQNWDQISANPSLQYGQPVAKASRRSYPNDFVDKGFLDFLLADNVQVPGLQQASQQQQQQGPFDLSYGPSAIGAHPQNAAYNDGAFMSQQHTFQWVPTPGASEPVPVPDAIPGPSLGVAESVGHKHKRVEESTNSGHSGELFGIGQSAEQHSGEHSGSDFEDNRKLTKAERTARMREKNKTAQKRWRDRQKVCNVFVLQQLFVAVLWLPKTVATWQKPPGSKYTLMFAGQTDRQ